jgi:hypothetical protein
MNEEFGSNSVTLKAWPARNLRCGAMGWHGQGRDARALTQFGLMFAALMTVA